MIDRTYRDDPYEYMSQEPCDYYEERKKEGLGMAINISKSERDDRNATIVKKVESILQNAEFDRHITIVIEAHPDEIPSIRYNITEDIVRI